LPGGGPDREWKDRDDVDGLVRVGRLTPEEAQEVWAEAERASRALDNGERWWSDWDGWTPDPGLDVPSADASLARLREASS
jgi:predicted RNA-binding protein associated with RNAse of E/G family